MRERERECLKESGQEQEVRMRWPLVANRLNTPKATKSGAHFSITNYCNHSFGSLTKLTYLLWSKKTNKKLAVYLNSLFPLFIFFMFELLHFLKQDFAIVCAALNVILVSKWRRLG